MGLGIYSVHPIHFLKSLSAKITVLLQRYYFFVIFKKKCNSSYTSKKSLCVSPGHYGIFFFFSFEDKIWKIAIHQTSHFNTPCHYFYGHTSTLIYLLFFLDV